MKRRLAIFLEFGFHDVKKFITNNFASKIAMEFDIVWFSLDKNSIGFHQYFSNVEGELIYIEGNRIKVAPNRIERLNRKLRKSWMLRKGLGLFHNNLEVGRASFKDYILGNSILKYLMERKTLSYVCEAYRTDELKRLYQMYGINDVMLTSCGSQLSKSAFATAGAMGLKRWYVVNSWKDLFIDNFVPFKDIDGIFVWSEEMRGQYLFHCPYIQENHLHVSGNVTFDALIGYNCANSRSFYAEKYQFCSNTKILYYTMVSPSLLDNEIDVVCLVAQSVLKRFGEKEYTILVRRNPNDPRDRLPTVELPANVRITKHYCHYDKSRDMTVQDPEGEQEWLDLLHYSFGNISVPSTVTQEFMYLGKPVFNIDFNAEGNTDKRLRQFFEAGFYAPLFDRDSGVYRASSPDELIENLEKHGRHSAPKAQSHYAADAIIAQMIGHGPSKEPSLSGTH